MLPLIDRQLNDSELKLIQLGFSTFHDGSGMLVQSDGSTIPGWRDFERVFAWLFQGTAPEKKGIFDVLVEDRSEYVGISVKSKELKRQSALQDLNERGRLYLEISNSSAKFWAALRDRDVTEDDFAAQEGAEMVGETIVNLVNGWHEAARNDHPGLPATSTINISRSKHVVVSYNAPTRQRERKYVIHTLPLDLPTGLDWYYKSSKCVSARDPNVPDEDILDWYGLSGGQLKYYPRGVDADVSTEMFSLLPVDNPITIGSKSEIYWPEIWTELDPRYQLD